MKNQKSKKTTSQKLPPGAKIIMLKTSDDFHALSYYTLCKLQDTTHCNPISGLPVFIARGEYVGELMVDSLGNFLNFR